MNSIFLLASFLITTHIFAQSSPYKMFPTKNPRIQKFENLFPLPHNEGMVKVIACVLPYWDKTKPYIELDFAVDDKDQATHLVSGLSSFQRTTVDIPDPDDSRIYGIPNVDEFKAYWQNLHAKKVDCDKLIAAVENKIIQLDRDNQRTKKSCIDLWKLIIVEKKRLRTDTYELYQERTRFRCLFCANPISKSTKDKAISQNALLTSKASDAQIEEYIEETLRKKNQKGERLDEDCLDIQGMKQFAHLDDREFLPGREVEMKKSSHDASDRGVHAKTHDSPSRKEKVTGGAKRE
jgi:hypothetical protein